MRYTTTLSHALAALSLAQISLGAPHRRTNASTVSAIELIQLVPQTASLENLAVRRNGDILATSTASSSLFYSSPATRGASAAVLHSFPGLAALLGIAEVEEDVFYVTGAPTISAPVAFNEVWRVDLQSLQISPNGTVLSPPALSLVGNISTGGLYNGMTRLAPNDTTHILLADSILGSVTRLDVSTGAFVVVLNDTVLAETNSTNLAVAVNGIHTHADGLYFTNLNQGFFGRVPIDLATGEQAGAAEVIATGLFEADDFALSADGKTAWVAMNGPDTLIEVDILSNTTRSRVAINSTLLGHESSVAYGRGNDTKSLYTTTAQTVGISTAGSIVRISLA